jgi:hypothetical protein
MIMHRAQQRLEVSDEPEESTISSQEFGRELRAG